MNFVDQLFDILKSKQDKEIDMEIVKYLVKNGKNIIKFDQWGLNLLDYAITIKSKILQKKVFEFLVKVFLFQCGEINELHIAFAIYCRSSIKLIKQMRKRKTLNPSNIRPLINALYPSLS